MAGTPPSLPRRVLGAGTALLAEAAGVLLACVAAVMAVFPIMRRPAGGYLFVDWHDTYSMGDLAGTLFCVRRAMLGEHGLETALLAAPFGEDLLRDFPNTLFTDLIALLAAPLGLTLGYNLAMLLILASNGLAAHGVLRLLGASRWPALSAAVVLAGLPLMADELLRGRPVTAWWAPAILGMGLCVASLGSWRRLALVVPGAALVAFAIQVYPFAPLLMLPWTFAMGLVVLRPTSFGALARGAVALGLASAIVLPGALELLALEETRFMGMPQEGGKGLAQGTDQLQLADLFVMRWGLPYRLRLPAGLLSLAALASLLGWRRAARWLPAAAAALLLLSISLGPSETGGFAPYTWLMEELPLMRAAPRPTRYALGGAVCVCLWLGVALSEAVRRWPRRGGALALALGALVLAQSRPYQTEHLLRWPQHEPIARLADEPLILELPLTFQEPQSQLALIAANPTPRMNPAASRLNDWQRVIEQGGYAMLQAVLAVQWGRDPGRALQSLGGAPQERELGLRYVVLHQEAIPPGQEQRWRELIAALPLAQVEVAGTRVVYALEGAEPR